MFFHVLDIIKHMYLLIYLRNKDLGSLLNRYDLQYRQMFRVNKKVHITLSNLVQIDLGDRDIIIHKSW